MVDQARLASCTIRRAIPSKRLPLKVSMCLSERPIAATATLPQLPADHPFCPSFPKHILANTGHFKDQPGLSEVVEDDVRIGTGLQTAD